MANPLDRLNAEWMETHTVQSFIDKIDPAFKWEGIGWHQQPNGQMLYVKFVGLDGNGANRYEFYVYRSDPRPLAKRAFSEMMADVPPVPAHLIGIVPEC